MRGPNGTASGAAFSSTRTTTCAPARGRRSPRLALRAGPANPRPPRPRARGPARRPLPRFARSGASPRQDVRRRHLGRRRRTRGAGRTGVRFRRAFRGTARSPLLHERGGQHDGRSDDEQSQRQPWEPVREAQRVAEGAGGRDHPPGQADVDDEHLPDAGSVDLSYQPFMGMPLRWRWDGVDRAWPKPVSRHDLPPCRGMTADSPPTAPPPESPPRTRARRPARPRSRPRRPARAPAARTCRRRCP